jgi:folate-binding Fe-S cluster repair protein YgfZ
MHYLGKLKRRMYRVHIDTPDPVKPGMALFSPDTNSGQGTGTIVEAARSAGHGYDALAVIQKTDASSNELRLENEKGPKVTLQSLPYEFPPDKKQ